MFELLLTACLEAEPSQCRTERLPGAETLAACREAARLGAAGFPAHFEVQSYPCVPAGTTPDFTVTEIAPGVFVHKGQHGEPGPENGGDLANLGFVIGPEAVAVIDTGTTPAVGAALLAAIRAETDLPVRYVILTHMHPDHSLGTAAFAGQGEVLAHHRMGPALESRRETYLAAMSRMLGPHMAETAIVLPDRGIAAPEEISLGPGRALALVPHPTAHTDNDLTVLDRASGTLFAGDLSFVGHLPAIDGSVLGWADLLGDLAAMEGVVRVVPGHGPVALAQGPAFAPTAAYLDQLIRETRAAVAAGTPMLEAIRTLGRNGDYPWLLFEIFHARNVTAAYKELEWE
ncbi:MAG: quinoprotein relay system zinc metallohydrolase 2 [Pseudomonadota bacterium]